jgi:hypothetical protein
LCRAVALSLPEVANSCIQESQHTRKDWLYSFHWKKPANPFYTCTQVSFSSNGAFSQREESLFPELYNGAKTTVSDTRWWWQIAIPVNS